MFLFSVFKSPVIDAKSITDLPRLPNRLEEWVSQPYTIKVNQQDVTVSYPYAKSEENIPALEKKLLSEVLASVQEEFPKGYKVIEEAQLIVFNNQANDHNIMFIHDPCTGEFLSYWIVLSRRIKRKEEVCLYKEEYIEEKKDCIKGQFVESKKDYELEKERLYQDLKFVVQSWKRYQKKRATSKLPNEYFKDVNFFFNQVYNLGNGIWYELFDYNVGEKNKSLHAPKLSSCFIDPVANKAKKTSKEFYLDFYECGQRPVIKTSKQFDKFSRLENEKYLKEDYSVKVKMCELFQEPSDDESGYDVNYCISEARDLQNGLFQLLDESEKNGVKFNYENCEFRLREFPEKTFTQDTFFELKSDSYGDSVVSLRNEFKAVGVISLALLRAYIETCYQSHFIKKVVNNRIDGDAPNGKEVDFCSYSATAPGMIFDPNCGGISAKDEAYAKEIHREITSILCPDEPEMEICSDINGGDDEKGSGLD